LTTWIIIELGIILTIKLLQSPLVGFTNKISTFVTLLVYMDKKNIIEQFNKNSIIKFLPVIVDITKLVYTL